MSNQNKNNNKDPLEQFFREKSGEFDIPFQEENWLKMERKLNYHELIGKKRKIQYSIIAASFLIISLLSYVTLNHLQQINELNELLSDQQIQETFGLPPESQSEPIPDDDDPEEQEAGMEADSFQPVDLHNFTSITPETGISNLVSSAESPESGLIQQSPDFLLRSISFVDFPFNNGASVSCSTCTLDQYNSIYEYSVSDNTLTIADINDDYQDIPEGSSFSLTSGEMGQLQFTEKPVMTLSLITGPDLSTVGSLNNFTDPGYQIGLTAELNIFNDLSLITGLIQAKVRYQDNSISSGLSASYNNQMIPVFTSAECSLLKIPLRAKYNFVDFNRSRIYATAELSSYIMIQEDYQFQFDQGITPSTDTWSGRTGTSHWFSNAGFSIGYEFDFLPHWSIRAEPYLKLPVREVGWGNARLYSVGSYFSLNFNI
jgi:hypothetical protein